APVAQPRDLVGAEIQRTVGVRENHEIVLGSVAFGETHAAHPKPPEQNAGHVREHCSGAASLEEWAAVEHTPRNRGRAAWSRWSGRRRPARPTAPSTSR